MTTYKCVICGAKRECDAPTKRCLRCGGAMHRTGFISIEEDGQLRVVG